MVDETDLMLEAYMLKYSDVDVSDGYADREVEVIYDKYTGKFEMIIS